MSTYSFYCRRAAFIVLFIVIIITLSFAYKWIDPVSLLKCQNRSEAFVSLNRSTRSIRNELLYIIDTPACKIPKTDIVNDQIRRLMDISHFQKLKKPHCHYINNNYKPPLVASNYVGLFVWKDAKKYYLKTPFDKFQCSYAPFWKTGPDNTKTRIRYGQKIQFNDSVVIPPTTEFVRVTCTSNYFQVYEDYFAFVPKTRSTSVRTQLKPNVLIFGLDSLSRSNFHRQMPQTAKTLRKLNFIEYSGYTKVADNTFPNLIPFFTGHSASELQSACWPNKTTYFDDCPFIWQKYQRQNYTTALVEEQSWLSMFTYNGKSGFVNRPTDYYYHTFDRTVQAAISRSYFGISKFCFGPKQSIDKFLDYSIRLLSAIKNSPTFGFFFGSTISHDDLNLPRLSDSKFANLFNLMKYISLTENSIIIFMADHGLRFGSILLTKEGYFESRMPLFTVSFPNWFHRRYPLAYANFEANSRRLTTHFDAHETLNDLVNLDTLADSKIRQRTTRLNQLSEIPRGISLFLPIPETRTCAQAGIPATYCTCIANKETINRDNIQEKKIAQFLVSQINRKIGKFPACAQLSLESVQEAESFHVDEENFIRITVQTTPGRGHFQALIKITNQTSARDLEISEGGILRVNKLGDRRDCDVGAAERLFCHCK